MLKKWVVAYIEEAFSSSFLPLFKESISWCLLPVLIVNNMYDSTCQLTDRFNLEVIHCHAAQ